MKPKTKGLSAQLSWCANVVSSVLHLRHGMLDADGSHSQYDLLLALTTDPAVVDGQGGMWPSLRSMPELLQAVVDAGLVIHQLEHDEDEHCVRYGVAAGPALLRKAAAATPVVSAAERAILVHDTLDSVVIDSPSRRLENVTSGHRARTLLTDGMPLKVVRHAYPLHDPDDVKKLMQDVVWARWTPKLDGAVEYLGHAIGMYLAFVVFYLQWLLPLAAMGVALFVYQLWYGWDNMPTVLFSLVTAVWGTLILQFWRRKQQRLAMRWDTMGYEATEKPRHQFFGSQVMVDPATGMRHRVDPQWKRYLRSTLVYTVSFTVLAGAVALMLAAERLDQFVETELHKVYELVEDAHGSVVHVKKDESWQALPHVLPSWTVFVLKYLSTVVYSLLIPVLDTLNTSLALRLTDFENHRTHSEHSDSLIMWVVFFFLFFF